MFRYRLHLEDGSDAGQATYSVMIQPGEEILVSNSRRFRGYSTWCRSRTRIRRSSPTRISSPTLWFPRRDPCSAPDSKRRSKRVLNGH